VVTEERADEVRTLLATLRGWAQGHPDVVAVGLAGSWARGDASMDSGRAQASFGSHLSSSDCVRRRV
jgi:hypothetical protein